MKYKFNIPCLIIVLVVIFLLFPFASHTHAKDLKAMSATNSPPFGFMDNDTPTGFNVEIFNAVAEIMNLDATVSLGEWNDVRSALENGKIDIILEMFQTVKRDSIVDFSTPVITINYSIFTRKISDISKWDDLADKEIIVARGDITHDIVLNTGISEHIIVVDSTREGLLLLS